MFIPSRAPSVPMLAFNHAKHRLLACEVCHRGVAVQARAEVPRGELCRKCHASSPDRTLEGVALWKGWDQKRELTWPVFVRLPAHAYFSHRRHVSNARIACETCHGTIAEQTAAIAKPLKVLVMDDCLDCHRREHASTDCAHCHE